MDGGYSRSEESDPYGNVVGSYSFVDGEGKARSLSYRAGANIGFVPIDAQGLHPEIMASFADFGRRHSSSASTSLKPLNQRETFRSYPKPTEPPSLYLPPVQGNAT